MKQHGFTLIEVLLVLAIIGILAAIGVPQYLRWIAGTEARRDAAALNGAIQNARTLAKRGTAQQLVTTANSATVTITPVQFSSGAWAAVAGAQVHTVQLTGAKVNQARTLVFTAPYGVMDLNVSTAPLTFTLTSTRRTTVTSSVDVISLMGKAVIR